MSGEITTEPRWIRLDVALSVHQRQLAEHGGLPGLRDAGLLESALTRPQQSYHYQNTVALTELAASLGYGIAKNHPFLDGNKRTALALTDLFLILNGYEIVAPPMDTYQAMIALAGGDWSEQALADWLKRVAAPRE
jgi:death-on-curing protein